MNFVNTSNGYDDLIEKRSSQEEKLYKQKRLSNNLTTQSILFMFAKEIK